VLRTNAGEALKQMPVLCKKFMKDLLSRRRNPRDDENIACKRSATLSFKKSTHQN
jgi:hypothetical protein